MLLLRTQRARRVITWLPIGLLAVAILGIVAASFEQMVIGVANAGGFSMLTPYAAKLTGYLLWTLSLGGLGAASSLGVNALDIRNDATFDVNDGALVALRLVVGAVFAFVISLVFTWDSFGHFLGMLTGERAGAKPVDQLDLAWRLLLPFLLGFSTPLALTVLERFIVAVETFFGARASLTPKQMAAAVAAGTAAGMQEQQDVQGQQPAPGRSGQQAAQTGRDGQSTPGTRGQRGTTPGPPAAPERQVVPGGQGDRPSGKEAPATEREGAGS